MHWEVAGILEDLAEAAGEQGDRTAVESYLRQALAIGRQVYEVGDPRLARVLSHLGEVLCQQGDLKEGQAQLSEAIGLREKSQPKDAELAQWRQLRDGCAAKIPPA